MDSDDEPLAAISSKSAAQKEQERIAHEQFIEQNAWAQPQRPTHHHGTPNLTHTDNWAEPGPHAAARTLVRNLGNHNTPGRAASPYTTPMPQRRTQPDQSSSATVAMGSDGPEAPSSVLAAPPTSDRAPPSLFHGHSAQGSPLLMHKQRQNGAEAPSWRNISGVSGTSTIDAPDSAEKERHRHQSDAPKSLPALLSEASAPQQVFDTSQIHRQREDGRREVYPAAHFRHQEGQLGTPAPLQPATGVGPSG